MKIIVRNYYHSDYSQFKANLKEANLYDPVWDSEKSILHEIAYDKDSRLIIEVDGVLAGSIHLLCWGGNGSFLFHFAIKKEFRGKGLGKRLLSEAEKKLKARGAQQVGIFVDATRTDLLDYYKARGYKAFINSQSLLKEL